MTGARPEVGSMSAEQKRELLRRRLREGELSLLSYGQQAMWFLHHVDPGNTAYHVPVAFAVQSALDRTALEWAIGRLEERHSILRTTYREYGGVPVQQVQPDGRGTLEFVDATGMDGGMFDAALTAATTRPFDLGHDPVLRFSLFQRPDGELVLLVVAHHIAVDGWSLYQCLEELGALYTARRAGVPPDLPEVTARYPGYVRWQAQMLRGPQGEQLAGYWRQRLSGDLPPLGLSTDRPRPPVQTFHGARHGFVVDRDLSDQLNALAATVGATLFSVLLAGLQALLFHYTNQPDIRVASQVAHREQAEYRGVVGYFADAVVLRTDLSGDPSFRELLTRVAATVLDALEHQDMPFSAVVEMLQPDRDSSRAPLCDVGFVMQKSQRFAFTRDTRPSVDDGGTSPFGTHSAGDSGLLWELGDLVLTSYPVDHRAARFDLELQVLEADSTISGVLTYNTDLFDPGTAQRLAGHLIVLLRSAVTYPDRPISQLELLPDEERELLLRWGAVSVHSGEGRW